MQLLPRLGRAPDDWAKEALAGSKLPYLAQIDDNTLILRDGRLMQVLEVDGFLFETADSSEINYRKSLRDAMLQAVGSSRFAIYHHVLRRRVAPRLDGEFHDAFSAELNDRWQQRLEAKQLFSNRLFLCLIRRPLQGRGGAAERWLRALSGTSAEAYDVQLADDLRALSAARETLAATLNQYGSRLLGTYDLNGAICSEPLDYLAALYNGDIAPVRLPETDIGQHLPACRVSFGAETIERSTQANRPRSFLGILSIKDYPAYTSPGMLDELLRLPIEFQITQSFAFVDRQPALGRIGLALRRMRAADDEAVSLRGELNAARDDLASGRAAFGEHHLTIAVGGVSPSEVDSNIAEVQAALTDLGIISVREDIALEAAFWAQFPGNFRFIARRALIASRNFASMASLHNFPLGEASGNHWGKAITVLETTAAGPYHFNFHQGDLGNFTVIGPSGSGKTVVLNFLLAQTLKIKPRIIFFDKDRGAELFLRAVGGSYSVLRVGRPSGLNPLRLDDTPDNRQFLRDWLARLVALPGQPLEPAELAQIREAVDASMAAPPAFRRLGHFAQLLRGGQRPRAGDLASRLAPWWGEGEHAWLFDNEHDQTDPSARIVGFDMTQVLDHPNLRTPAMMYLFHRVEERLDGTPAAIVVDEGWKALDDDVFTARIRDWEKTIRKRNGIVGFATQSAEDALGSRIASAIVEQAATQIFMANPKAQVRDYVEGFGLTEHEFDLVRTLPDKARAFLVKHGRHSVVARLDLTGERDLLTILSGRESTVRRLDLIREEVGDDPSAWLPRLVGSEA